MNRTGMTRTFGSLAAAGLIAGGTLLLAAALLGALLAMGVFFAGGADAQSGQPSKPANLKVVVNSQGTGATVTWQSGGSGIGGSCPSNEYSMSVFRADFAGEPRRLENVSSPYTLSGLTPGVEYRLDVSAYSYACNYSSPWQYLYFTATSGESFPMTPTATPTNTPYGTPPASPSPPINIRVAVNSQGTGATVTWQSGGSGVGGNCPTDIYQMPVWKINKDHSVDYSKNYSLDYEGVTQGEHPEIVEVTSPHSLTGLTSGVRYLLEVASYGEICSRWSKASLEFTATPGTTFPIPPTSTPTATNTPTLTPTSIPSTPPTPTNTPAGASGAPTNTPGGTTNTPGGPTNTPGGPTNTPGGTTATGRGSSGPTPTLVPVGTGTPTRTPMPTLTPTPPVRIGPFAGLGGRLVRVWHLDARTQTWSFYDPAPEMAKFNTLTEFPSGLIVFVIISEGGPVEFQGRTLQPGINPIRLE